MPAKRRDRELTLSLAFRSEAPKSRFKLKEENNRATFQPLPAPVQVTVRSQAGAAEIADIDTETRDGMVVYEISFKDEGKIRSCT
ncbi:MAG: hypothetical protein FJ403_05575 [Verrucomicrobia bacterium]|nr:hypothetical protein [Verrucomicrobiota bacterium]